MTVSMNVSTNQKESALNSMLLGQSSADGAGFGAEFEQSLQSSNSRQDLAEATHGYDDFQQKQGMQPAIREQVASPSAANRHAPVERPSEQKNEVEPDATPVTPIEATGEDELATGSEDASQADILLSLISKANALQANQEQARLGAEKKAVLDGILLQGQQEAEATADTGTITMADSTESHGDSSDVPLHFRVWRDKIKPTEPSDPKPTLDSSMQGHINETHDDLEAAIEEPDVSPDDLALDAQSYWRLKQQEGQLDSAAALTDKLQQANGQASAAQRDNSVRRAAGEQSVVTAQSVAGAQSAVQVENTSEQLNARPQGEHSGQDLVSVPLETAVAINEGQLVDSSKGRVEAGPKTPVAAQQLAKPSDAGKAADLVAGIGVQQPNKANGSSENADDATKDATQSSVFSGNSVAVADGETIETGPKNSVEQPPVAPSLPNEQSSQSASMLDAPARSGAQVPGASSQSSSETRGMVDSAGASQTETKLNYAEFMQQSNQQDQQSQQDQQAQQEQRQPKGDSAAASTSRSESSPLVSDTRFGHTLASTIESQPAAHTAGVALASASSVSNHMVTHVNKLAETAKAAELSTQQLPLDLQQPTAAAKLMERVMYQVHQKIQTAEVQLHPEDLGAMQIKLSLQQDQVTVQFLVQQSAAKEAVEQQLPRLKDLLQQQGMQLADGQVEQRQSGNSGQSAGRQSQQGNYTGDTMATDSGNLQQQGQVKVQISERAVDYYA